MSLLQVIYVSEHAIHFAPEQLRELVAHANRKNELRGITGALYCGEGAFIQAIEGDEHEVIRLYARILEDDRHKNVQLLSLHPTQARNFPEWGMGLVEGKRDSSVKLPGKDSSDEADWNALLDWFRNSLMASASSSHDPERTPTEA